MSLNYFYTGAPPHGIINSWSVVQVSINTVEVSITVLPVARTFGHHCSTMGDFCQPVSHLRVVILEVG